MRKEAVGAVYDRALCRIEGLRAVIDRAYSSFLERALVFLGNNHFVAEDLALTPDQQIRGEIVVLADVLEELESVGPS